MRLILIFQGDSGGPFFIETDPNRYEVFGVVSFGDGCARNIPGIYGRLSYPNTLSWIKQYIKIHQGNVCTDPAKKPLSLFDEMSRVLEEEWNDGISESWSRKLFSGKNYFLL